jgi:hypothetical protein
MATEKETLQERADELGLDTEGTIAQLKEAISAADAEENAQPVEPAPEVVVETVPEAPVVEALPESPVNPVVPTRAPVPVGAIRAYDVHSAFWIKTQGGLKLAQNGGTVRLTEKQAAKYVRHGNISLAV